MSARPGLGATIFIGLTLLITSLPGFSASWAARASTGSHQVKPDVTLGQITGGALVSFRDSDIWHEYFCVDGEICRVGDFDGDGRDDIAAFLRSTQANPGRGDVYVALSEGRSFGPGQIWHSFFCVADEVCRVGDFNGDGRDDIAAFLRDGPVWVALSDGSKFASATIWDNLICLDDDICEIGDVNGDGRDDVIKFVRTPLGCNPDCEGAKVGEVIVYLSSGSAFRDDFPTGYPRQWHPYFCLPGEVCDVGDFDGDGRDDIITFIRDVKGAAERGDVRVALSNGSEFTPQPVAPIWHPYLCIGQEICRVGDLNGDGRDDVVAFARDTKPAAGRGDVVAATSRGNRFEPQPVAPVWHEYFCVGQEICETGDFNGDGQGDIITFLHATKADPDRGDVYVALAERVYRVYLPALRR